MIKQLQDDDAQAYADLRLQALTEAPLAFGSSPENDIGASLDRARELLGRLGPDSTILGSFDGDRLVGTTGLYRTPKPKTAHKAHVWGMYVTPACRRQGRAEALLQATIDFARALDGVDWIEIGVTSAAPEALALYEKAGFVLWGTEPDALRHEGLSADLHSLGLRITRP
jgi:GNAT superfamily N-acetyltransferase